MRLYFETQPAVFPVVWGVTVAGRDGPRCRERGIRAGLSPVRGVLSAVNSETVHRRARSAEEGHVRGMESAARLPPPGTLNMLKPCFFGDVVISHPIKEQNPPAAFCSLSVYISGCWERLQPQVYRLDGWIA
ncbi:unnamed protein product [Pleuronectes platessa]|uniref:Uncharacterized protein n=1 Tax=Pleuronectes platessa TaxID=8262 RepID=A0A9N7W118_PLEPL|nr:unnamed protein product [Pleuronectes platessa]